MPDSDPESDLKKTKSKSESLKEDNSGSDEDLSLRIKPIKEDKLKQFQTGIYKKSKFQLEKEAAEAKKQKELEEANRVYEEFVASFDDGSEGGKNKVAAVANRSWVKGATIKPSSVFAKEEDNDDAPREVYKPSAKLFLPGKGYLDSSSTSTGDNKPASASRPDFGASSERGGLGLGAGADYDDYDNPRPSFAGSSGRSGGPPGGYPRVNPSTSSLSRRDRDESFSKPTMGVQERSGPGKRNSELAIPSPAPPSTSSSKKRNLDTFLEELKRTQEEREERAARQKQPRLSSLSHPTNSSTPSATRLAMFEGMDRIGSHDTGDPSTTNLYVGNLSPAIDEHTLCLEFGKYGPIASVKIMWPRTIDEKERNRNCGFVSFMKREDAAVALREMDGKEVLGYMMRCGWGKAVPLPKQPYFVVNSDQYSGPQARAFEAPTGLPFGARPFVANPGARPRIQVTVRKPADQTLLWRIHRTVERVAKYGPDFEGALVEREQRNCLASGIDPLQSDFAFLFDFDSPDHVYYRWKLYSILQGDPIEGPSKDTPGSRAVFEMYDEGPPWAPPILMTDHELELDPAMEEELLQSTDSESSDSDNDSPRKTRTPYRKLRGNQRTTLPPRDRRKLVLLLQKLDLSRRSIAKTMLFAMDRADAAEEIVNLLVKSLVLPATPVFPLKVSRLYVISDLLHNSGASLHNAWKFRSLFQQKLKPVFQSFGDAWRKIPSRLKAEQVRKAVWNALDAWESWIVFPREVLEDWKAAFMGTKGEKRVEEEEDLDGIVMQGKMEVQNDEGRAQEEEEDLDGVPLQEPAVSGSGRPAISKFVPIGSSFKPVEQQEEEEEYLDGAPMKPDQDEDEDLDGVPMF